MRTSLHIKYHLWTICHLLLLKAIYELLLILTNWVVYKNTLLLSLRFFLYKHYLINNDILNVPLIFKFIKLIYGVNRFKSNSSLYTRQFATRVSFRQDLTYLLMKYSHTRSHNQNMTVKGFKTRRNTQLRILQLTTNFSRLITDLYQLGCLSARFLVSLFMNRARETRCVSNPPVRVSKQQ